MARTRAQADDHGPGKLDLHSGKLYWLLKNGMGMVVPPLEGKRDVTCDVLIIGAGITGALVAEALTRAGLDVLVLDRRDLAQGSTAASTALLQYDIDVPLYRLIPQIGEDRAVRAYQIGIEAIDHLERVARQVKSPFERKPSLYYARTKPELAKLRREFEARQAHGFKVLWLGKGELRKRWGVEALGAIYSSVAAQTDPFQLCQALLHRAQARGARIHDRTSVLSFKDSRRGVTARTSRNGVVRARWLVHASGYEAAAVLPKNIVNLRSTYALATEPLKPKPGVWKDRALLWECADTYLYARWADDRLLIGGEDEDFHDDAKRDALICGKAAAIIRKARKLLPGLSIEPAFAWAGTFGSTKDGIGYIGPVKAGSRVLFALGFGGNGITYSTTASVILTDHILQRKNADAEIFRFGR